MSQTADCHSERSEESLADMRTRALITSQRCFASLNMTDDGARFIS